MVTAILYAPFLLFSITQEISMAFVLSRGTMQSVKNIFLPGGQVLLTAPANRPRAAGHMQESA